MGRILLHGFTIDPKEDMITVFMAQLHPGAANTADEVHTLAYAALADENHNQTQTASRVQ